MTGPMNRKSGLCALGVSALKSLFLALPFRTSPAAQVTSERSQAVGADVVVDALGIYLGHRLGHAQGCYFLDESLAAGRKLC